MVAERRYVSGEEQFNSRRLFRCSRCTIVAGVEGFNWSRFIGIECRNCRRTVYILAERGPSPYRVWPWTHVPPLTPSETLTLLSDHRDDDGILFLSSDDIELYHELRAGRQGRSDPSWRR